MKFSSIAGPIFSAAWFATLLAAGSAGLADPIGEWRVADGNATIRVHRCGADLCGNVASTVSAPGKDSLNPDPRKRNRSVLGLEVLINLRLLRPNLWAGTSYNAQDGQYYQVKLSMLSASYLRVEGCAPGGGACGSETWTRVK